MSKYCKPMGLYVTYLDCMECEDKECRKPRKEKEMKRTYLSAEVGQEIFLVFASIREKYNNNVVLKCVVDHVVINENGTHYYCKPIKVVTDKKDDIERYKRFFQFQNSNIDTGLRNGDLYPVFTTKEGCIKWLKQ